MKQGRRSTQPNESFGGVYFNFGVAAAWSPFALGASLIEWHDAEQASSYTESGGAVSSWRDIILGRNYVQAIGAAQPMVSTMTNGRPAISADGVDDELTCPNMTGLPLTTAFEMWSVVQQNAAAADVSERNQVMGGNGSNTQTCRVYRSVTTGVNRAFARVGNGATSVIPTQTTTALNTIHVTRLICDLTNVTVEVDGVAGTPLAMAGVGIVGTRKRLFAGGNATPAGFWNGLGNTFMVTALLSAGEITSMYTFCNARKA